MANSDLKQWERIILGIDPGTNVMGYGLIGVIGKKPSMIAMGVIQLNRFESHYLRLSRIFERVTGLVEQYLPDEMAIEAPFFGKNVQSMLKLGRAQGVAMAAALSRDVPITEYEPRKIKMAITGNGASSKRCYGVFLISHGRTCYHNLMLLMPSERRYATFMRHPAHR